MRLAAPSIIRSALARPARAVFALACGLAIAVPALAQDFTPGGGSLLARKLQNYDPPTSISVEPMDDNSETVAAAAAVRKAFERRGLKIADDGGYVLEIEVDPAVTTGIGARGERMAPSGRGMTRNDGADSLRQLAPTEELSPQPRLRDRDRQVRVPHLAVTLNLYDGDAVPVWTALVMARRSNRPLEEQSAELALAALDWFGRSNDRGVSNNAQGRDQSAVGR